ncbi:MAG TPA: zinc-ribbon domain-containing protein [Syntrophomonadaceae bacterium]|nr:zinc-ribbon domain-containing protein [Syntrophomonadaceae bacterium]
MAYCPQCGTEVPEGSANFCPSCGVSFSLTESDAPQKSRRNKLPFIIAATALLLIIAVVSWKFIFNSRLAYAAVHRCAEAAVSLGAGTAA